MTTTQDTNPDPTTDEDYYEVCECELDWSCPMHNHQATPEDRIATAWSQEQG